MNEVVSTVFNKDIHILNWIDKAIIYFREGKYEQALLAMGEVSEDITYVADTIMKHREYFELVSVESISEMLEGILNAKHAKDFVLLADLLELQMESFLCNVQSLIMSKEDLYLFDEITYLTQITMLHARLHDSDKFLAGYTEELDPQILLDEGYRVELTSCGLMTLVAKDKHGIAHYLHSNHKISEEAYLLARSFVQEGKDTYVVAGLGLGYHIQELLALAPDAAIEVYERDMNIIKLCCAFSNIEDLLEAERLTIFYDPDGSEFESRALNIKENEKVCIHYPSYRRMVIEEEV